MNKALNYLKDIQVLNVDRVHPVSDFVKNPEAHIARLKQTRLPEVLTVNGQAEVVMLDAETYESLMERLRSTEAVAKLRAHLADRKISVSPLEPISMEEMERRHKIVDEIVAETEQLGLYG